MIRVNLLSTFVAMSLLGFSAIGQVAVTSPAVPATPLPSVFYSSLSQLPPMGLASSETAQVNIVNNSVSASTGGTVSSCTGTVTFYNASGTAIGKPASFDIGGGQIFSTTLPYASTGESGARTVIRVAISIAPTSIASLQPPPPPCALASSLETYDASTGVTHAFVAGTQQSPLVLRGQVKAAVIP